jgi:hypothetical protein
LGRHGGRRRFASDRGLMIVSAWLAAAGVAIGAVQLGVDIRGQALGQAAVRVTVVLPGIPPGAWYEGAPADRDAAIGPVGPFAGQVASGYYGFSG